MGEQKIFLGEIPVNKINYQKELDLIIQRNSRPNGISDRYPVCRFCNLEKKYFSGIEIIKITIV